jgi:hypothetical protein
VDGETKVLQTVDEAQNVLAFGALVEVVCAEVLIEGAVFEHVVGGGEDGSGDGDNGLLWITPGAEAQVSSLEVTSFFARGRPGAVGAAFSGAFVVFGQHGSGIGDCIDGGESLR